jgi:hypothetical protein
VWLLGRKFFTYTWNTVDFLNYCFFVIPMYYKLQLYLLSSPFISATVRPDFLGGHTNSTNLNAADAENWNGELDEDYIDLDYAGWLYNMLSLFNGFNSLFTWLKIFSFLRFLSSQAAQFIQTISQAAANLGIFMALLIIVLWYSVYLLYSQVNSVYLLY